MRISLTSAILGSLLVATALTPVRAADMTHERALNAAKEPHNWLLYYNNYQGHRFSTLKEINLDTVKNLKPVFSVALEGIEGAGARHKTGNLEATPIVEDGIMYVPNGWGVVYAFDVSSGKKATLRWKFDPETNRAWAADVACCGVNNRGVALWKDKIYRSRSMGGCSPSTGNRRRVGAQDPDPTSAKLTHAAGGARRGRRRHRRRRAYIAATSRAPTNAISSGAYIRGGQAVRTWKDGQERWARRRSGRPPPMITYRHVLSGDRQCRPRLRSNTVRRQQVGGGVLREPSTAKVGLPYAQRPLRFRRISGTSSTQVNARIASSSSRRATASTTARSRSRIV